MSFVLRFEFTITKYTCIYKSHKIILYFYFKINFVKANISTASDGRIHFGDLVLLKCDGNINKTDILIAKALRKDCYLSANSNDAVGLSSPIMNSSNIFTIIRFSLKSNPFY
jgi:hypothetical protein